MSLANVVEDRRIVRSLVVPIGPNSCFDEHFQMVSRLHEIPYYDLNRPPSLATGSSHFKFLNWTDGSIVFDYHRYDRLTQTSEWTNFQSSQRIVLLIGVVNYCELITEDAMRHMEGTDIFEARKKKFEQELEKFTRKFPSLVLRRIFVFNYNFDSHRSSTSTVNSQLTSSPVGNSGVGALSMLRSLSGDTESLVIFPPDGECEGGSRIEVHYKEVMCHATVKLIQHFEQQMEACEEARVKNIATSTVMSSLKMMTAYDDLEVVTITRDLAGQASRNKRAYKRRFVGRIRKWMGDLCMQVCSPIDAVENYVAAIAECRSLADPLWLAGALDGYASAVLLLRSMGLNLEDLIGKDLRTVAVPIRTEDIDESLGVTTSAAGTSAYGSVAGSVERVYLLAEERLMEAAMIYSCSPLLRELEIQCSMRVARMYELSVPFFNREQRVLEFLQRAMSVAGQTPQQKMEVTVECALVCFRLGLRRKFALYLYVASSLAREVGSLEVAESLLTAIMIVLESQEVPLSIRTTGRDTSDDSTDATWNACEAWMAVRQMVLTSGAMTSIETENVECASTFLSSLVAIYGRLEAQHGVHKSHLSRYNRRLLGLDRLGRAARAINQPTSVNSTTSASPSPLTEDTLRKHTSTPTPSIISSSSTSGAVGSPNGSAPSSTASMSFAAPDLRKSSLGMNLNGGGRPTMLGSMYVPGSTLRGPSGGDMMGSASMAYRRAGSTYSPSKVHTSALQSAFANTTPLGGVSSSGVASAPQSGLNASQMPTSSVNSSSGIVSDASTRVNVRTGDIATKSTNPSAPSSSVPTSATTRQSGMTGYPLEENDFLAQHISELTAAAEQTLRNGLRNFSAPKLPERFANLLATSGVTKGMTGSMMVTDVHRNMDQSAGTGSRFAAGDRFLKSVFGDLASDESQSTNGTRYVAVDIEFAKDLLNSVAERLVVSAVPIDQQAIAVRELYNVARLLNLRTPLTEPGSQSLIEICGEEVTNQLLISLPHQISQPVLTGTFTAFQYALSTRQLSKYRMSSPRMLQWKSLPIFLRSAHPLLLPAEQRLIPAVMLGDKLASRAKNILQSRSIQSGDSSEIVDSNATNSEARRPALFYDPFATKKKSGNGDGEVIIRWSHGSLCHVLVQFANPLDVPLVVSRIVPVLSGEAVEDVTVFPQDVELPPRTANFALLLPVRITAKADSNGSVVTTKQLRITAIECRIGNLVQEVLLSDNGYAPGCSPITTRSNTSSNTDLLCDGSGAGIHATAPLRDLIPEWQNGMDSSRAARQSPSVRSIQSLAGKTTTVEVLSVKVAAPMVAASWNREDSWAVNGTSPVRPITNVADKKSPKSALISSSNYPTVDGEQKLSLYDGEARRETLTLRFPYRTEQERELRRDWQLTLVETEKRPGNDTVETSTRRTILRPFSHFASLLNAPIASSTALSNSTVTLVTEDSPVNDATEMSRVPMGKTDAELRLALLFECHNPAIENIELELELLQLPKEEFDVLTAIANSTEGVSSVNDNQSTILSSTAPAVELTEPCLTREAYDKPQRFTQRLHYAFTIKKHAGVRLSSAARISPISQEALLNLNSETTHALMRSSLVQSREEECASADVGPRDSEQFNTCSVSINTDMHAARLCIRNSAPFDAYIGPNLRSMEKRLRAALNRSHSTFSHKAQVGSTVPSLSIPMKMLWTNDELQALMSENVEEESNSIFLAMIPAHSSVNLTLSLPAAQCLMPSLKRLPSPPTMDNELLLHWLAVNACPSPDVWLRFRQGRVVFAQSIVDSLQSAGWLSAWKRLPYNALVPVSLSLQSSLIRSLYTNTSPLQIKLQYEQDSESPVSSSGVHPSHAVAVPLFEPLRVSSSFHLTETLSTPPQVITATTPAAIAAAKAEIEAELASYVPPSAVEVVVYTSEASAWLPIANDIDSEAYSIPGIHSTEETCLFTGKLHTVLPLVDNSAQHNVVLTFLRPGEYDVRVVCRLIQHDSRNKIEPLHEGKWWTLQKNLRVLVTQPLDC